MMRLVCITGIDGTGKTTLAKNTAEALSRQGKPARYIYGRTYPVLSRLLMALGRVTLLRRKDQWRDYRAYTASKQQTMRNPVLAATYTCSILLDYYVQIWWKLLPHLGSNRIIVSDRYIYDTVISDLTVHLNYSVAQTAKAVQWGLKFLPMPELTVLIDVPEDVAFARKDDVPHIDYLRERRKWYLTIVRSRPEVQVLDGTASPGAVLRSMLEAITTQNERKAKGYQP